MGLTVALAGCELFPLDRHDREPAAAILIEAPAPQITAEPEPEPEKPMPPLPAAKPPVPVQQARLEPPPNNGNGAASAAPAAPEQLPPEPPPPVVGLNRSALIAQFGPPAGEREAAPARVLEFSSGDCQLAAYLYFDTARNDFYALQYQVNGIADRNDAADRCLMRIRDAARR